MDVENAPGAFSAICGRVLLNAPRCVLQALGWCVYLLALGSAILNLQARSPPFCRTNSQAVEMAKTEEGKRLVDLQTELTKLGVSSSLMSQAMGEKEEETARRLRRAKDTQVM